MDIMSLITDRDNTSSSSKMLMLKDKEVAYIGESAIEVFEQALLPVGLRVYKELSFQKFYSWLNTRVIPLDRENSKKVLNRLGLSQSDKLDIIEYCKGLSLTDCYWIKDVITEDTWESVNLYTNKFSEAVAELAFIGSSDITVSGRIATPETVTQGSYAKCWSREENGIYLYKGNYKNGNESAIEVIVSEMMDLLGVNHVAYTYSEYKGREACKCKNITSDKISIVPFYEFDSFYKVATGKHSSLDYISNLYPKDFYSMLLVDGIFKNTDRHSSNWGFYMNPDTGSLGNLHELFDHNNSLVPEDDDTSILFPNKSLIECGRYAYRKLGKPEGVQTLKKWLKSKSAKKRFHELKLDITLIDFVLERIDKIEL